ncbi:MAG: folate family ECF transporter S component [Clostridia bacterium]|nr:folate family ECF transporter S component [Clostridia bacterium]
MENYQLFSHPFSKAYWKAACAEFKKTKVLIFAALMIALRVALKAVSIPIGPDLRINTAFFINAYGAMVFGPVVAIVAAAISDTLGCLLFPTGVYFFPFIFVEIAGSLVFALFLYRTKVTTLRVMLSRFCICFFVNIVLNTPIMMWYYQVILGKYYAIVDMPRIAKNLCMFPIESVLLTVFLRAMIPISHKTHIPCSTADALRFTKKNIVVLVILFVLGVCSVFGYSVYNYNNTSLSASYSASERLERNNGMTVIVTDNEEDLVYDETAVVIESAIPHFRSVEVVYDCAVYAIDADELEANIAEAKAADPESKYGIDTLRGYSKSKAKADDALVSIGRATIVLNKKTGEVISYELTRN